MKDVRHTTYHLGTICGGSEYIFTGLGEFKTADAARARAASEPRSGRVLIFRHAELYRHGVNYGSTGYEAIEEVMST